MDVEIDNLVIKAVVEEAPNKSVESHPWQKEAELELLIEKCLERVLRQLEDVN